MNSPCADAVITAESLSVYVTANRTKRTLVDQSSFSLQAGEVISIIGPNGAGKSSLLKAISGELSFSGKLSFNGLSVDRLKRARQLAVLPQLSLLNFPYKVHEVVALGRLPHKTGWSEDQLIIQEVLALLDIDYLAERRYTKLSGGEKQRVQLARVLCQIWRAEDADHQARILLLDEPNSALDLGHQQELMKIVSDVAKQGVAVMMVMHDINLAIPYSDKILAMLCSQTIAFGSPVDVIKQATIEKLFQAKFEIVQHPQHQTPLVIGASE